LAAYLSQDGYPMMVPDVQNKSLQHTPSAIVFNQEQVLVGDLAESYAFVYPDSHVIRYYKRRFGSQEPVWVSPEGKAWFSESLAAIQLRKIAHDFQMFSGETITGVVVTVPAHYSDNQRKSVIDAAKLADLPLLGIIEEPVAAAIHHSSNLQENELIMVFDLGGGTFDLTLVTKIGNEFHVLAKDGLPSTGGKEFTELVADKIKLAFKQATGYELPSSIRNQNKVYDSAEEIKIKLSDASVQYLKYQLTIENTCLELTFSRDVLKTGVEKLMDKVNTCVVRCLRSVGIPLSQINKIVMVGGGCLLPEVKGYWEQQLTESHQGIVLSDPFHSIAKGAAVYASSLHKSNLKLVKEPLQLKSVSSFNLGLQESGNPSHNIEILIQKNLPLPVSVSRHLEVEAGTVAEYNLIQFWDLNDASFHLGSVKIGPFREKMHLKLIFENREDGTIGMKVKSEIDMKDVPFGFTKKAAKHTFSFEDQKNMLRGLVINNI